MGDLYATLGLEGISFEASEAQIGKAYKSIQKYPKAFKSGPKWPKVA